MVRESWAGLGYYRRAANLHRLAQEVVRDHAGVIPADPAVLVRLPGIGRYTAGAVASFAYERATPAIDTNVARVIRRAFHPRLRRQRRRAHSLGDGRRDRPPPARRGGLGVQSGDHGARRAGLHRPGREMRGVPGPERVRDGRRTRDGTRTRKESP